MDPSWSSEGQCDNKAYSTEITANTALQYTESDHDSEGANLHFSSVQVKCAEITQWKKAFTTKKNVMCPFTYYSSYINTQSDGFIRIKDQYIDNAEIKGIEEEQGEFLLGLPAVF